MATNQKKRAVVSYENMSEELAAAFAEKYPKGFSDYLPDLIKYDKPEIYLHFPTVVGSFVDGDFSGKRSR